MTQQDDRDAKKEPADIWPEPPGYLGEAVRRAKRIPARAQPVPPPAAPQDLSRG